MLTLWYIILGWKEYNKSFRKAEHAPKSTDPAKKPDLIPQRKDVTPSQPKELKKPEPPKSIMIDPRPPASQTTETFFNSKTPEIPKTPEVPKVPEMPKATSKTPETPKVPETPKIAPKTPETLKMPEPTKVEPKMPDTVKMSDTPKVPPRTSKTSDFRLAPEVPKKSETPRTPEFLKTKSGTPKTLDSSTPDSPEGLPSMTPSRRPESVMPDFPPSARNPAYVPPPNHSEFPLPPYLPGAPQNNPTSKDEELFATGNTFNSPSPNRPLHNLRDLSYAKGEYPSEETSVKIQDSLSKVPERMYVKEPAFFNEVSSESEDEDF